MRNIVIISQLLLCFIAFAQDTGARYLIITNDAFYDAVQPLMEWKYRKGMKSKSVSLSETGSSASQIRDYIINAYYNWDIPPEYVLLVGAPNYLPLPQINSVYTDNYYGDMYGDLHNEILPGRLTVHDQNEAQTVIQKILAYERTPDRTDTLWFKKACLIIRQDWDQDDSIYWSDAHYAKSLMLDAGFVKIDTFSNLYGDNQDSIVSAVHEGRGVVMFRGAGLNNWHPPFSVDPEQLHNGTMLPILLSITCQTVGTSSTPCTVERWLLNGTPLELMGTSAFFASTRALHYSAHLRSAVAKGFHNAWFNESKRTFGECCEGGRCMVYNMYPYAGGIDSYREFLTVGDPEMNLWTDTPCSLIISHPVMIPIGPKSFSVTVSRAHDLSPVENALVCITGRLDSTVYAIDTTDASGNANFTIHPHLGDDSLFVTVTGLNLHPYEGFMTTFVAFVYVVYLKSEINDSLGGNNDGLINPGEQINLPLWVKNYGDSSGIAISGLLRTADLYTTITDSSKSFGNIPGSDSAYTGNDGYDFTIADNCPDGHLIYFALDCSDNNDTTWSSYFFQKVYAAELDFEKVCISGGNGNHTFEPGETVTVVITLKNYGSAPIDSVMADLQCISPYVSHIDTTGMYAHIGPDSMADNQSDPFIICSDVGTPQGTYVDCQMIVHAGYLIDTMLFSIIIGKMDYFVWNPELTPTSGQHIHTLLTSLGYTGVYDTVLTPNLHEYATLFICTGIWPNNYIITFNSVEAMAISGFTDDGGRIYLEGGDVWYYDPLHHDGFDFAALFGLSAIDDGTSDMGPIIGQTGTFTNSMYFSYAGENRFMDHIEPENPGAFLIFQDRNNYYDFYDCGVAYDRGTYRTVGTSFELGLLEDDIPPSTRIALLDSIMHFFGITPGVAEQTRVSRYDYIDFRICPNPVKRFFKIMFHSPDDRNITIDLYDVVGRQIKVLFAGEVKTGTNYFSIVPKDLAAGIYFVRVQAGEYLRTEKIVLLK